MRQVMLGWREEEVAIILFFASAGATELKAIVGLLRDQGFTRTKNAVRSKLSDRLRRPQKKGIGYKQR